MTLLLVETGRGRTLQTWKCDPQSSVNILVFKVSGIYVWWDSLERSQLSRSWIGGLSFYYVCILLVIYPTHQQWYRPHTILIFHSVSYKAWGPQRLPFLEDVHGLESNLERLCDVCDQEDRWLKRVPLFSEAWLIFRDKGQSVGCLLLTLYPQGCDLLSFGCWNLEGQLSFSCNLTFVWYLDKTD